MGQYSKTDTKERVLKFGLESRL